MEVVIISILVGILIGILVVGAYGAIKSDNKNKVIPARPDDAYTGDCGSYQKFGLDTDMSADEYFRK